VARKLPYNLIVCRVEVGHNGLRVVQRIKMQQSKVCLASVTMCGYTGLLHFSKSPKTRLRWRQVDIISQQVNG